MTGKAAPRIRPRFELGSEVEIGQCLIDGLEAQYGHVVHCEGRFHVWSSTHWTALEACELRRRIQSYDGADIAGEKPSKLRLSKSNIDGAMHEAAAMSAEPGFFDAPVTGVNCVSGLVRIDAQGKVTLNAHRPDQKRRHRLAGRFEGSVLETPPDGSLLATLLNGCFGDSDEAGAKSALLAELAGAAAHGLNPLLTTPKATVFFGERAENGKSQCLELLKALLPAEATCSITPAQMAKDQYLARLAGKHLNTSDELGQAAIHSDVFKMVVTGEPVHAKIVYLPPFEFRPQALHVFSTNALPGFTDGMARGVRRRLQLLVFNRVIPQAERISHIAQRIANEETDLLLSWAIGGAMRLLRQGHFTDTLSGRSALANWIILSDPVAAFLEDEDVVRMTGEYSHVTTTKQAYRTFSDWARREGLAPAHIPPHGQFTARIKALPHDKITVKRRGKSGNQIHGIQLRGAC